MNTRFPHLSWLLGLAILGQALAVSSSPLLPGDLAEAARAAGIHVGAAMDGNLSAERLEVAAREFTSATTENSLKWVPVAPSSGVYDFAAADGVVDWAETNGLRVRGHTLFWGRQNTPPAWVVEEVAAAADPAAHLTGLMQDRVATTVGRYAGRIAQWDVVNEPLPPFGTELDRSTLYGETLGDSYLDIAFDAAHAADPGAALFLNEVLTEIPTKFDGLVALVEDMLARGVPIDGVGLQGHFFLGAPDRDALQSQLERIGALGLLVELTEVDIPLPIFGAEADPLAAQAEAYADVFSACLAVAACTGVTTWGIDDADTWLDSFELSKRSAPNRPLLFDELLEPKPAYGAVVSALRAVPEPGMGALGLLAFLAFACRGVPGRRAS